MDFEQLVGLEVSNSLCYLMIQWLFFFNHRSD